MPADYVHPVQPGQVYQELDGRFAPRFVKVLQLVDGTDLARVKGAAYAAVQNCTEDGRLLSARTSHVRADQLQSSRWLRISPETP